MGITHTTERTISLGMTGNTNDDDGNYISQGAIIPVSLELSRMNNRLYRQGMDYTLKLRHRPSNTTAPQRFDIFCLPNTWFVKGAIQHAYNTYHTMLQDELAQGIKPARWHDFAIDEQNPDGIWDTFRAILSDGDQTHQIVSDEIVSDSTIKDAAGTARGFHLFGNKTNSYNIFEEYAKVLKYNKPSSNERSSDQPYDELLQLDNADELAERGDKPPYDSHFSVFLPQSTSLTSSDSALLNYVDSVHYDRDGGNVKTVSRSFVAPLGLVFVRKFQNGVPIAISNKEVVIEVSAGAYKGVKALSITCPE